MSRYLKTVLNRADFVLTLMCLLGLICKILLLKRDIIR